MDACAYARQLKQLLPRGELWSLAPGSWLSKLLLGIADELVRIDGRAAALVEEWDPRTATETLAEWERVLSIVPAEGATNAQRRLVVATKLIAQGGQTPLYFIFLAESLGFVAMTVESATPHLWTMTVDLGESTSPFTVQEQEFRSGASRAGDRLNSWTIPELENEINRLKPAHSRVLFVYHA